MTDLILKKRSGEPLTDSEIAFWIDGYVTKMSGRGLGFTGGTIDKLEGAALCKIGEDCHGRAWKKSERSFHRRAELRTIGIRRL